MTEHAATDTHAHGQDHGHDHGQGHGHGHGHGEVHHSHQKQYIILGVVLTVLTLIELALPFDAVRAALPLVVLNWSLVVLAVVKFILVIGIFMHLRDDRRIFSLLFVSPLIIALLMILILQALVSFHWSPFDGDYQATIRQIKAGERPAPWAPKEESHYQEQYAAAEKDGFSVGKEMYAVNCASCHRVDGGGGLGPAFTDDCYIHGGQLSTMRTVIENGVAAKGMPAWGKTIGDEAKLDQVTYYVRSMKGATVENPKACQGEKAAQ